MSGKILVLCEKPDQGRKVAEALGGGINSNGYITTKNHVVTWGIGHLLGPKDAEDYDPKFASWSWDTLTPDIIPSVFQYKPREKTKAQLRTIAGLAKETHEIIIATDPDREGELIAYLILNAIRWKGPLKRLWLNDLTLPVIRKAFTELLPAAKTYPLYQAALARMQSDWIFGIVGTRAMTVRLRPGRGTGAVSVGRVQTPTLALIVRNERAILSFKSTPYYELTAQLATQHGHRLTVRHAPEGERRITDLSEAEKRRAQATGATNRLNVKQETKQQEPPDLFHIGTLQQECNSRFGWSAKHTLGIAQKLYDAGYLSYPRSDRPYLPEEHVNHLPEVLSNLKTAPELAGLVNGIAAPEIRKSVYDSKKATPHYAIVPTAAALPLNVLGSEERNLFLLVAKRFLAAHMPAYVYEQTVVTFDANGVPFRTTGNRPVKQGWRAAFQKIDGEAPKEAGEAADEEPDEALAALLLPPVVDGELAKAVQVTLDTKHTQPPKRFTEKTLLAAMENPARFVTDPAHRKRLRETSGLGTPATWADTIEKIKKSGYIETKKREIHPTELGCLLIDDLDDTAPMYADIAQTAVWEDILSDIAQGKAEAKTLVEKVTHTTLEAIHLMKTKTPKALVPAAPAPAAKPSFSPEERADALAKGTKLKVPFDKKENAKKMGAMWDPEQRCWVAPPGADLARFRKAKFL